MLLTVEPSFLEHLTSTRTSSTDRMQLLVPKHFRRHLFACFSPIRSRVEVNSNVHFYRIVGRIISFWWCWDLGWELPLNCLPLVFFFLKGEIRLLRIGALMNQLCNERVVDHIDRTSCFTIDSECFQDVFGNYCRLLWGVYHKRDHSSEMMNEWNEISAVTVEAWLLDCLQLIAYRWRSC